MGFGSFVRKAAGASLKVATLGQGGKIARKVVGGGSSGGGGGNGVGGPPGEDPKITNARNAAERDKDLKKGEAHGKRILGPDGLGKLSEDADIQESLGRFKERSEQGLGSKELEAERTQMFQGIDRNNQTALRGLQSRLSASGVRGATAGQQIGQQALAGAGQKTNVERDLFLKTAEAKRQGLVDLSSRQGAVKTFDLAQEAREKDIVLQAGLGQAQLGVSERAAVSASAATSKAAAASSAAAGGKSGLTVICTELNRQGLLSNEMYIKDCTYTVNIKREDPYVYIGYYALFHKCVPLMQKSTIFTKLISIPALAWAKDMSGEESLLGNIINKIGKPICRFVGKVVTTKVIV